MTDKAFKCIVCRTILPTDAPKSVSSISCSFCDAPNPNPKNLSDNSPAEYSDSRGRTRTIQLSESYVSLLSSIVSIVLGIVLIVLFAVNYRIPRYYLLVSSVLVFLPVFAVHFVPAHWEKVCKWATSETGDKYKISYTRFDIDWINYVGSYVFQVRYFGLLFINIFQPSSDDALAGIWIAAMGLGFVGVWILDLSTRIVARWIGLLIPRSK